jgi:tripartite-type tricarboxylate transporter receptor subunit TctC
MKLLRRQILRLVAGAAAVPGISRIAGAQDYPNKPVRLIVGFPAGNAPDIIARLIGQWLSDQLGQQFIIENRPGAASNIATEAAVSAPADGYTLLLIVLTNVLNQALYSKLKFDFIRDVSPVAIIANAPFVLIVTPSFPAQTVPELIAHAKANPGKINMASGGNGAATHVFGELFKTMAGVDLVHVPYRSSYMPDLLSGEVQLVFNPIPQSMEYIRSGRVRALGVTTARRLEALPGVPALGEFVPGYEAIGWFGLGAPGKTPANIVNKLNAATSAAVADPKLNARLVSLGVDPMSMSSAQFGKFVRVDFEKWASVIKSADIKPE